MFKSLQTAKEILFRNWNRPSRLWNLVKVAVSSYVPNVSFGPVSADIETTLACNLACVMCHRRELAKRRKVMNISLENFKKIIDDIPTLLQVKLQGMGEPLLTPDLFDMIRYAKSKGIIANFVSNGKIMTRQNAKDTIESGLDRVYFSIDSADPAQYAAIRAGGNLETVIENVGGFMTERKALGSKTPYVGIWMLLFKENLNQLRGVIDIAKQAGVDELVVQTEITDRGKSDWKNIIASMQSKNESETDHALSDARMYAKEQGVRFSVQSYVAGVFKKRREDMCTWAWKSLYITSQGDVSPCCIIADPDIIGLGNIYEEGFKNLWNNKKYQVLRKQFLDGNIPAACRGCYYQDLHFPNAKKGK